MRPSAPQAGIATSSLAIRVPFCISYLFCCCEKKSWQKKLQEERIYLGLLEEGTVQFWWEVLVAGAWGSLMSQGTSGQVAQGCECPSSASFFISIQSMTTVHGVEFPTFRVSPSDLR